jgi:hypothetical protein
MNQSVIFTDQYAEFDEDLFGVDEMEPEKIRSYARRAAEKIAALIKER